jgi:diaminopimelate decarboxylase
MSLDKQVADRLAAQYGTPLFVYDLDEVEAARDELLDALPEEFELFYALKANSHLELVRELRGTPGHGCRTEISSTGELSVSVAAGHDPAQIIYTGPGKTDGELDTALATGVRMFSVESLTDLEHIGAAAVRQGVVAQALLRINHVAASATTSIRMTGTPSQFGIDSETLGEVLPALRAVPGTELAGLHFFPMSNARDEESLIGEFQHTIEVAAEISAEHDLPLKFLDIGGGFSVPYAVPGSRASYPKLRSELSAILDLHFAGWRDGSPRIACESGRYLVGASGTLITRVTNIKKSRGRTFVIADAGINTFGGMSGLGRLLPVAVQADGEATQKASLVGPLCTPGDVLGRDIALPGLDIGDIVAIPNAGAYGPTASLLMFLGRPAPTEVVIRGDEVVSVSRIEHERTWTVGTGPHVRM